MILCVHERLTKINERFPTTNVMNAAVLVIDSGCQSRIKILYIANTIIKTTIHCNTLKSNVLLPKSGSLGSRGKRDIIFASSFSHSKMTEHAGSIINSMNTTCTG